MKPVIASFSIAGLVLIAGCTWVTQSPEALQSDVQTLDTKDALVRCEKIAANELKVAYKLGSLQRMPDDVEHDLRTMAINQAATVGADAVAPLTDVKDGVQTWGLFNCKGAPAPAAATSAAPSQSTGLKTLPYTPPD
ncbi:MAG TPA: hypothetical protein VLV87_06460 [Gammaproteobacteria bacterium]|nr:hypothetical protein [Gammaproteobacteria bacterium]